MSLPYEQKAIEALTALRLDVAQAQLDQAAQQAAAAAWSYTHFLGYLLDGELRSRHEKTVRLNLQFARLPYPKRLEDFDFTQQPGLDRRLVEELATLRFLHQGRNLVLLGPPGVGKTHLGIALGMLTAEAGHRIYFTTAIELARRMAKALVDNRLAREIKNLTRPKLLHRSIRRRFGGTGIRVSLLPVRQALAASVPPWSIPTAAYLFRRW